MPNFSAQCVKGVQGMGYLCAFILSLAICVPMSMHQDQFKGRCLLFSTGHWQEQVKAQSCRDSNQILSFGSAVFIGDYGLRKFGLVYFSEC